MNRHDEIQAKARDIASNIHADRRPENLRTAPTEPVRCESVGQLGYRCTLPTGHPGEHRAEWTRWS